MSKKLFRNTSNKVISGVCSGFGLYFNIDTVLVRGIWALFTFFEPFIGLIGYFVCAIAIPDENNIPVDYPNTDSSYNRNDFEYKKDNEKNNDGKSLGIVLMAIGIVLLLKKVFDYYNLLNLFELWPLLLIFAGLYIIVRRKG